MPSKLTPALIGGAIMGFLSSMPIIAAGNCLCCIWIILGGLLAGHFYSKTLPPGIEFKSGDGAVIGLLAGMYGALFKTFLIYLLQNLGLQDANPLHEFMEVFKEFMETAPNIPAETEEMLYNWETGSELNVTIALIFLIRDIFIGVLFGMIGGLFSTKFFKNTKPPHKNQTMIL